MSLGKWSTKQDIDDAFLERDIDELVQAVRDPEIPQEVRNHLADVLAGLLSGKIKFPRGRPRKPNLISDRIKIGQQVRDTQRAKKLNKVDSAVRAVVKELRISPTTVWKSWAFFDRLNERLRREKAEHDFTMRYGLRVRPGNGHQEP